MSTIFTDPFTRADSGTLGGNWSLVKGSGDQHKVLTNQCVLSNLNFRAGDYYSFTALPNDHWAQATIPGLATKANVLIIRTPTTGTVAEYYGCGNDQDTFGGLNTTSRLLKFVAGSPTSLGTGSTTLAGGQVLYLEAQGTNLVFKINGTNEITTSDGSLTSGQSGLVGNGAANFADFDDFSTGDFAATAGNIAWVKG